MEGDLPAWERTRARIDWAIRLGGIPFWALALLNLLGWIIFPPLMNALHLNHWVMSPVSAIDLSLLQAALFVFYHGTGRWSRRLAFVGIGVVLLLTPAFAFYRPHESHLRMSPITAWLTWMSAWGVGLVFLQTHRKFLWKWSLPWGWFWQVAVVYSSSVIYMGCR